jgi:hypothetical protein
MKQVTESSMNEIQNNNIDILMGLFPFMLAAAGKTSDLSSIYE